MKYGNGTSAAVLTIGDFGSGRGEYTDTLNTQPGLFAVAYDGNGELPVSDLVRHIDLA